MIHRSHQSKPKAIKKNARRRAGWQKNNWQLEGKMNPANGTSCDHSYGSIGKLYGLHL
jgi:hypothetical protein